MFPGKKPLLSLFFTKHAIGFYCKGLYACLKSLLLVAVSSVPLGEMFSDTQKSALFGLSLYPAYAIGHDCV